MADTFVVPKFNAKTGEGTLSGAAVATGIPLQQLLEYNPQYKENPNMVKEGAVLNLIAPKSQTSTADVPTGDTQKPPDPFKLDMSEEPSSDLLKKFTSFDDIKTMLETSGAAITKAMTPSAEELQLKKDLAEIRAKAATETQALKDYENKLPGEGISSGAIQGRSWDVERNVNQTLERLGVQEKNLLTRLGLEQDARTLQEKIASGQYGQTKDIIENAFKIQDKINQQKTALINATDKMTDNARQALGTILTNFKGIDFHALDSDAQLKLQSMATKLGIPIDVIVKGMEVNKMQEDLDNAKKRADLLKSTNGKNEDWAKAEKFIQDNPNATRSELETEIRKNTGLGEGDITSLLDSKVGGGTGSMFLSDQNIVDVSKALVNSYAGSLFSGTGGTEEAKTAIKQGKIKVNGKDVTLTQKQIADITAKIDELYPKGKTFWQKAIPWGK